MHEMRLLLASLIFNFDFELCEESSNWIDQRAYALWEKNELYCRVKQVAREHDRERELIPLAADAAGGKRKERKKEEKKEREREKEGAEKEREKSKGNPKSSDSLFQQQIDRDSITKQQQESSRSSKVKPRFSLDFFSDENLGFE